MKILIVDDHPLYIDGLKSILETKIENLIFVEALTTAEGISILEKSHDLDLALVDLKLPGSGGLGLLQHVFENAITTPCIVVSGEDDIQQIHEALELGACGYIAKSYRSELLTQAIETVKSGGIYLADDIQQKLRLYDDFAERDEPVLSVTPRQLDVLILMRKGYSNKQISNELEISTETVKEHISNLFALLDVDNRISCLYRAEELGLDLTHSA